MGLRAWVVAGVLLSTAASAKQDVLGLQTVYPLLPGKNNVRWWEFDWKYEDFVPLQKGAPVRLYFYESEKNIAEVAKPFIAAAYAEHAEQFNYLPSKRIPFLLYNSHFEFLSTRAFFLSEGTLGVTSTEDLTMALPYWGEHERFQHVMKHELAHQFTIQKVNDLSGPGCRPLQGMPLWFVEGIAEYYSRPNLTSEVRAALADRVLDGKPHPLPRFFGDEGFSFERVYLIGHAQVRFLEEEYGKGTIQKMLDDAKSLCAGQSALSPFVSSGASRDVFAELVSHASGGDKPEEIDAKWHKWARRQVVESLDHDGKSQTLTLVKRIGDGEIDSLTVSPDGKTLAYRVVDRESGVSRVYLRDVNDPKSLTYVTQDQRMLMYSLHPAARRVTAVSNDLFVFIGRVTDTDVVFVRPYKRVEEPNGRVRIELGPTTEHNIGHFEKLIEAGYPAISPSGKVAFSGLSRDTGFMDLYRIDEPLKRRSGFTRLTNDPYAEESLAYAPDGTLFYTADATSDGRYELFKLEGNHPVQVTSFTGDQTDVTDVCITQYGTVFTSNATGLDQAWRLDGTEATQLSNVPTFFHSPGLGPNGALLGVSLIDGLNELVILPEEQWLNRTESVAPAPPVAQGEVAAQPVAWEVPHMSIDDAQDYRPLSELRLMQLYGAVTGGPYIFGAAVFGDRFKSTLIGLDVSYFREVSRSNGAVTYLNQTGRISWGGAAFFTSGLQIQNVQAVVPDTFVFQRFGVQGLASYPLGHYTRIEGYISPQAIRATDFTSGTSDVIRNQLTRTSPAIETGAQFAIDTTKLAYFGPYSGVSFILGGSSTFPISSGVSPFFTLNTDLQGFQPLLTGYERLFVYGRLAGGASLGSGFREDFYVPATQNLRAYRPGSLLTIGEGYYLGQFELQFPVAPEFAGIALQGVLGMDAGAVFEQYRLAWDSRVAAGVAGAQVSLGPIAIGVFFARTFGIGGTVRQVPKEWITHFEISTPFAGLPGF